MLFFGVGRALTESDYPIIEQIAALREVGPGAGGLYCRHRKRSCRANGPPERAPSRYADFGRPDLCVAFAPTHVFTKIPGVGGGHFDRRIPRTGAVAQRTGIVGQATVGPAGIRGWRLGRTIRRLVGYARARSPRAGAGRAWIVNCHENRRHLTEAMRTVSDRVIGYLRNTRRNCSRGRRRGVIASPRRPAPSTLFGFCPTPLFAA